MIKINSIKLRDFMAVESADFDFEDSPIVMLWGRSGQGKSAVLDAMVLCWTGKKRSGTYLEYIRQGRQSGSVEMEAEIRGEPISFKVELFHKNHTPFTRTITHAGKTYTNNEATEFIDTLDVVYYFDILAMMQGPDSDVVALSPARRSEYMQRLFNFSFEDKLNKMRAELDSLNGNKTAFQAKKETNDALIKTSNDRLGRLAQELSIRDVQRIHLRTRELEELIDEGRADRKKRDELQSEIIRLSQSLTALAGNRDAALRFIATTEATIREEREKISLNEDNEKKQIELKKQLAELEREGGELDAEKKLVYEGRSKVDAELEANREQRREFKRWSQSIEEKICPHCGQPSEQHAKKILVEKFKTDDTEAISKNLDLVASLLAVQSSGVAKNIIENEAAIRENSVKKLMLGKDIKSLEPVFVDPEKLKLLQSNLDAKSKILADLEHDVASLNEELTIKNAEVASIIIEDRTEEKNELARLREKLTLNDAAVLNNEQIRAHENEAIATLSAENSALDKRIEETSVQINIREEAINVVSKHFINWLVVKTCDDLQHTMNEVIHSVFNNYHVRLEQSAHGVKFLYTKNYGLSKDSTNRWLDGRMSSGFERSLLSVAFRYSLCLLYGLPICFMDEVDGHADEESSKTLYEYIFSSNAFSQMFLISHKPEIRFLLSDMCQDAKIYSVDDGRFTLE